MNILAKSSILVGGQAVIEGVMMRVPGAYATAVKSKDGEICIQVKDFDSLIHKKPFLNVPIIRGAISLFEAFKIGMSTLQWSSEIAMGEKNKGQSNKVADFMITLMSITFALLLFIGLPLWLASYTYGDETMPLFFNIISGAYRILIFLLYLTLISFTKDAKTLFEYHGAEHKAIYVFENGEELIPESAIKYPTQHPRCGTSFMLIVMIVAIFTFSLIDQLFLYSFGFINIYSRVITHILFIPLVSGFGYEILKKSSGESVNIILRLFTKPGIWLQHITTKPPNDEQLLIAFTALKSAFGDKFDLYKGKRHIADAIG